MYYLFPIEHILSEYIQNIMLPALGILIIILFIYRYALIKTYLFHKVRIGVIDTSLR